METYKLQSVIRRGDKEGHPIVSKGRPVRALAIPSDIGAVNLSMEASFDGTAYFPLDGISLSFLRSGNYSQPAGIKPAPTVELLDPGQLVGLPYLRPVIDTPVKYDIPVEFWVMGE